jgi:LEA14-like dessication related protein
MVVCFGLSGCSLPDVKLKDALLTKLTTKNLEIGLNLEIFNPNEYSIPLSGVDWDLDLFRADFTNGQTGFTRNIPGNRRADVEVPIGISFQSVRVGVQNLLTKREIPWKIGGGCSFRIPASEPVRVGFQQAGRWTNPLMR